MLTKNAVQDIMVMAASQPNGNSILGSLGQYGGFQLGSAAAIATVTGDIAVSPDSGGAPGTYRVFFPNVNADIMSIDWFHVGSFTPRAPTGVETVQARVCGYNFDATLKQWYITVQVALLSDGSVDATPPTGFVVGVRAAFTYNNSANPL